MDQTIRNKLRNVVTQCRKLLEDAIAQVLQGQFGIYPSGKKDDVHVEDDSRMGHLADEDRSCRKDLLDHLEHIKALGYKPKDALAQLVREVAFTHLNRLCAYKMMESREVWLCGQRFREAVSRGLKSQGFLFYLAQHAEDEKRHNSGQQDVAYRHFLDWLGGTLSEEIGVLFSPTDPANRLYPPQRVLEDILDLLNTGGIKPEETDLQKAWPQIWSQDEAIGWVYQYFTPKELRDQARKESAAPRNSYELSFRNQFFTPRYVVEFLTDNTLGRLWYEMRIGNTRLKDQCRYLVRRPDEIFLSAMALEGHEHCEAGCKAAVAFLQEGTEDTFQPFTARSQAQIQRMIDLSHCVSAYQRHLGTEWDWFAGVKDRIESGRFDGFSTQEILDFLFLTCRNDRHGGDGSVYKERWFVDAANEVRRRTLRSRQSDLSQEELLKQPALIPHRPKKDPRELRILDPACGSGHFLLYCFDLLYTIYEEAYTDDDLAPALQKDYATLDDLRRDVPRLILAHNLHGIDIDLRATQIAALALWLRCQRAYKDMGLNKDRPQISRSNVVCAEPMPGEKEMLREFTSELQPKLLGHLVEVVFDKMRLAGEAGSLLKIEEELRDAIAAARRQWVAEHQRAVDKKGRTLLFSEAEMDRVRNRDHQPPLFDVSEITEERFWSEVELRVLQSLQGYAAHAANGGRLRRQLFAEDAAHGFAFVDVFEKHFDLVLMNPPFGEPSANSESYLSEQYPTWNGNVLCAFTERALGLTEPSGMVGAIYDRTAIVKTSYEDFRRAILLSRPRLAALADLGWEVLDANVEVTSSIFQHNLAVDGVFVDVRAIPSEEKATVIRNVVRSLVRSDGEWSGVTVNSMTFRSLPNAIIGYDFPRFLLSALSEGLSLAASGYSAYTGHQFRTEKHFRAWWEVALDNDPIVNQPLFNGSGFSPYTTSLRNRLIAEVPLDDIRRDSATTLRNKDKHLLPGICFGKRGEFFCAHVMPAGMYFSLEGLAIPVDQPEKAVEMLGILNTSLARLSINKFCGQHKTSGYVNLFPYRNPRKAAEFTSRVRAAVASQNRLRSYDETQPMFSIIGSKKGMEAYRQELVEGLRTAAATTEMCEAVCSDFAVSLYAVRTSEREMLDAVRESQPRAELPIEDADLQSECRWIAAHNIVSHAVGAVFGRWDVRHIERKTEYYEDPFEELPAFPPVMLLGSDGVPATASSVSGCYPIQIKWDGMLVDEPSNPDDICARLHTALGKIIGVDEFDEDSIAAPLGVRNLQEYLRKPGKGGLWSDHIKRYSKAGRKAPIYWLLQSSKKSYALWFYYHRLDKDILFKALVNYVEPKIRLEENRLDSLRAKKGAGDRTSKKLDKDIEKQEEFLSELRDFEEKLRRAADFHLVPDLNDGVVLNIAPLWELVPWKEAKSYWEELMDGKYEWSSIGKQLREKGLVK